MNSFARDLREWRWKSRVTQAVAAEYLRVSLRTYSGYETGKRVPPYRDIQRIRAIMALSSEPDSALEELVRA
jgi:transcriptional regulator with XRE-family HTH domain